MKRDNFKRYFCKDKMAIVRTPYYNSDYVTDQCVGENCIFYASDYNF